MSYEPPALFVAWREPESHRIFTVGRLLRVETPFRGFEFGYVRGVKAALEHGFEPFVAFPELGEIYRSRELLPFFKNRVLLPSRPDYLEYLESFALDRAAEPMTLLAASGGRRTTDLIELFPDWVPEPASERIQTRFLLRGVRYIPSAEPRIEKLQGGERLYCMRDVQNVVNREGIALRTEYNVLVGYLPDYLATDVGVLLMHDQGTAVGVLRVNPPPAPAHHRVLCMLSTRPPQDFRPFRTEAFRM